MVRGVPIWDGPAYLLLWNCMVHGAEKPRSWAPPAFLEGGARMKERGAGGRRRPGEGAGGGHPSHPARGYRGAL